MSSAAISRHIDECNCARCKIKRAEAAIANHPRACLCSACEQDRKTFRERRPPTERQLKILSVLDQFIKIHNGASPTFRELAVWCSCKSVRTVTEHVHSLIRKGLVENITGEQRTLSVTGAGSRALKLAPVVTIPWTNKL